MGAITEKEFMENLEFKCARCQADCVKVNGIEPELGYTSHAPGHEGEFIGPICQHCFNQISDADKAIRKIPETAFLVVVKQDGEGAYMSTEEIPLTYLREPTFSDVIDACNRVATDINDALFAQKLTNQIIRTLSAANKKSSQLIVPR